MVEYVTPGGGISEEEYCQFLVQIAFMIAKGNKNHAPKAPLEVWAKMVSDMEAAHNVRPRPETVAEVERIIKSRMN